MDRVFSARIDEATIHKVSLLARLLGTSRKAVVERAINELVDKIEEASLVAVLDHTHGTWRREESAEETVCNVRRAFDADTRRHHK